MRTSPHDIVKHGKYKRYSQSMERTASIDDDILDEAMSDDSSDTLVNVPIPKRVERKEDNQSAPTQPIVFSGLITHSSTNGTNYVTNDNNCNPSVAEVRAQSTSNTRSNGLPNGINPNTIVAEVRLNPPPSPPSEEDTPGEPLSPPLVPTTQQNVYNNSQQWHGQQNGAERLNVYPDMNIPRSETFNPPQIQNVFSDYQHQLTDEHIPLRQNHQQMPENSRNFQYHPSCKHDDGTCIGLDVHKFLLECCQMLNDEFVYTLNTSFRTCLLPLMNAQAGILESQTQFISNFVNFEHAHHDAIYCQLQQTTRGNTSEEQQIPQNCQNETNHSGQNNDIPSV